MMNSDDNERNIKVQPERTVLHEELQRKLQLFGHTCRIGNSRRTMLLVFGIMDETCKV